MDQKQSQEERFIRAIIERAATDASLDMGLPRPPTPKTVELAGGTAHPW